MSGETLILCALSILTRRLSFQDAIALLLRVLFQRAVDVCRGFRNGLADARVDGRHDGLGVIAWRGGIGRGEVKLETGSGGSWLEL